jgi:DNA-binding NtrC family response regulator
MSDSESVTRATVLLTGVEPHLRAGFRQALAVDQVQVVDAANGYAALRAYARMRGEVDLLIAPTEMRDYDGVALARSLSALCGRLPVLLLGGQATPPPRTGANVRFLRESIAADDLAEAARRALASSAMSN